MAADARVLVLDEPTSSLSVDERNALHARLRALAADDGLAVIYVSHFLDDILDVASTVSVLRDGKLVHRGETSSLDEESLLAHMTGGSAVAAAKDLREVRPADNQANAGTSAPGLEIHDLRVAGTVLPQLTVRPGEIVGLYGLEDSGARDVIEGVFGLRSRSGVVSWAGRRLRSGPRHAIRAGVTLVTGDRKRAGIPRWSVEANHELPRLSQRPLFAPRPRRSMRRHAQDSIRAFGIKATAGQQLCMLSGGNQQKLLLARWVGTSPTMCLLLDEPTHGVDVGGRRAIYAQLRQFAGGGNTVLLHSTDPEEIVELCDRAIPFSGGHPLAEIERTNLSIDRLEHAVRASARHDHANRPTEATP
jgi:ABC-type sugar transport system ATPase subunit